MRKHKLIVPALCCFALCLFTGCRISITLPFGSDQSSYNGVTGVKSLSVPPDYSVADNMEHYDYSHKSALTEQQMEVYNLLIYMLDHKQDSFNFENIENDDFKEAYYAVLYDHPEYIRTGFNYTYSVRTIGGYAQFNAKPSLLFDDPHDMEKAEQDLEAVVSSVVSAAKAQPDPYYMIKYVHDYIIDNTVYDIESLEDDRSSEEGLLPASTAYGCLVQRKAVCSGYSAAFQLIMQRLGFECGRINGTRITETGAHQWNYVGVDGEYYFMDLTWDDPITSDGGENRAYDFFMITDADLAYTHVSDRTLPQPVCRGIRYNYFYYNGLYFDEYDFRYVSDAAQRMREDNGFSVKFSTPDQTQRAVEDLVENQRIFRLDFIKGGITYSVSTSGCILSINY